MDAPIRNVARRIWRDGVVSDGDRAVPEETAVALTYNGGTHAVMMATPLDLDDFAIGFSLSERIVASPAEIETLDVIALDGGVELRMWLPEANEARLRERRRQIAGPTGCGLCGVDSISAALTPPARVGRGTAFSAAQIMTAMQAMAPLQTLNDATRAVHAAALWTPADGIAALREDVGRHNALDKLAGAVASQNLEITQGILLLTCRVSIEMIQKAAVMGATLVSSVSAPTAQAVRMADAAGITLVAIARSDGFEIFSHASRVRTDLL